MKSLTTHASQSLPRDTQTRMQYLLDQGDQRFFADRPTETERVRLYFKGEAISGGGEPTRYIKVFCRPDGRLVRQFLTETAGAA